MIQRGNALVDRGLRATQEHARRLPGVKPGIPEANQDGVGRGGSEMWWMGCAESIGTVVITAGNHKCISQLTNGD
jgi:hypothetical protein